MIAVVSWALGRIRPLWSEKLLLTVSLTALFCVFWFLIPRYVLFTVHTFPLTDFERSIPFIESFVYVYMSICLFMPAAPFLTVSRPMLVRHAYGFLAVTMVSFVCFVFFPVEVAAPAVSPSTLLYTMIQYDTRLNSLPSLHAGYTVYSLLYWEHVLRDIPAHWARWLTALLVVTWACLLMVSVLLLKQHNLQDLIAGCALAAVSYWLSFRSLPSVRWGTIRRFTPLTEVKQ